MANDLRPHFVIEPLDKHHDRSGFDCRPNETEDAEYVSLNSYIQRTARKRQDLDMGRTYVAVEAGQVIVRGYYTLSASSVDFADYPENKNLPEYPIPALLLGKLAVDKAFQGHGLGRDLLLHAFKIAIRHADGIGVTVMTLEAINESAERFYRKHDFAPLNKPGRHLYLTIKRIRQLKL